MYGSKTQKRCRLRFAQRGHLRTVYPLAQRAVVTFSEALRRKMLRLLRNLQRLLAILLMPSLIKGTFQFSRKPKRHSFSFKYVKICAVWIGNRVSTALFSTMTLSSMSSNGFLYRIQKPRIRCLTESQHRFGCCRIVSVIGVRTPLSGFSGKAHRPGTFDSPC